MNNAKEKASLYLLNASTHLNLSSISFVPVTALGGGQDQVPAHRAYHLKQDCPTEMEATNVSKNMSFYILWQRSLNFLIIKF